MGGQCHQDLDILNSMIHRSRWSLDCWWLFDHRCYIHPFRWSCFDNGDNDNLQPSWGMAGVESSWRFGKKYSSSYFRHLCPCQLVSLASKTHDNCFLLKLFPSRSARPTNMSICNHTKNANFRPGQFHQDLPDQQGVGHSLVGWKLLPLGYQTGEHWSQLITSNIKM